MCVETTHAQTRLREVRKWPRRKVGHAKRRVRTIVITRERRHVGVRSRLAGQYLRGSGLEIGALHMPLRVPAKASVRYVDRCSLAELRDHYPELDDYEIVTPDVIDDGETLATVPDGTVDFVIANHMIEHCENPIATLENHLRVLRAGGIIYMAVPDRRFTFDRDRPVTSLAHLRRDYLEGPECSHAEHYREWAGLVEHVPAGEVERRARELDDLHYSIHFHVFTPGAFLELLSACRTEFGLPFEVEGLERNNHEFIVILSRAGAS